MENEVKPTSDDLMSYLGVAVNFRNHELNIQLLRNVVYTGAQGVFLIAYARTLGASPVCNLGIGVFGLTLSILWCLYYRASVYWVRYWEAQCRKVNDYVVSALGIGVNIFDDHHANTTEKPKPCMYAGKTITYFPVHKTLRFTQLGFCLLWIFLFIASVGIAAWKAYAVLMK
jgi:hypothetical protein